HSTGNDRADSILQGVIGIWEAAFPGSVRGYYLYGSYANGTAEPGSDLDLTILFKAGHLGSTEADRARRLCEYLEAIRPIIWVDMGYLDEESVQEADRVSVALQLKWASRLVYGEDTRATLVAAPDERYVRDTMHIPYYVYSGARPGLDPLP